MSDGNAGPTTRDQVLAGIYGSRFPSTNGRVEFSERRNCFRVEDSPSAFEHVNPTLHLSVLSGSQLADAPGVFPPFTIVEMRDVPCGRSWFAIDLELKGPSYDYFVGDLIRFWVDGPDRVLAQILAEDIPQRGYVAPEARELFETRIAPCKLPPKAYDIVIFQPGVQGVSDPLVCTPLTGDVYRAPVYDEFANARAQLFVTRSLAFWVDLRFEDIVRVPNSFGGLGSHGTPELGKD